MSKLYVAFAFLVAVTIPVFAQQVGGPPISISGGGPAGSAYNPASVAITGGTIDNTTIGGLTPAAGSFNGLTASGSFTAPGLVTNADLANPSTTVNGTTCTLGTTCTPGALALGVLTTTATSNPSATTSGTGVMMGLSHQLCAGSTDCSITPAKSGKVVFVVSGKIQNSLGGASGSSAIDLYYGTGTAPTNGTAPGSAGTTRTDCTSNAADTSGANEAYPVNLTCVATGLTVGTAYWVDAALTALTGGTTTMKRATISAYEIY